MMNKVEMLEHYINQAEEIIQKNDAALAKQFQHEVVAVYNNEITDIRGGLSTNSPAALSSSYHPDYISDVRLLKAKLLNYFNNLRSGLYKVLMANSGTNINVSQEMNNTVLISLEQVVESINQIPDTELSSEDKEVLTGKLASMSTKKDKSERWEKAKSILKWLADKGVDAGIAALPYIAQAIQ